MLFSHRHLTKRLVLPKQKVLSISEDLEEFSGMLEEEREEQHRAIREQMESPVNLGFYLSKTVLRKALACWP